MRAPARWTAASASVTRCHDPSHGTEALGNGCAGKAFFGGRNAGHGGSTLATPTRRSLPNHSPTGTVAWGITRLVAPTMTPEPIRWARQTPSSVTVNSHATFVAPG